MASSRSDRFRTDIQALRALAVVAVVVNHVWPDVLPGGYVGVDVFFVISGFLITSHLVEHPPARLYDLAAFWGRRIRRLLPAALLVLGLTLIAVRTCTPQTTWEPTARSVRAAATYWLNWLLAHDAVDYLRGDDTATAVQHYWSLSVEEQFYLVWPVLLLIVGWLARRRFERVVPVVLAVILVGSLTASVWVTHANASAAYFVTHTRIWELAAGGLLAVLGLTLPKWASWIGWAGIAATCVLYSDTTAFPGYTALLPVTATIIVIAAHDQNPLVSLRPVTWLGDISYSLYLWHWPVFLITPYAQAQLGLGDTTLNSREKAVLLVACLTLAWATKTFIEDPIRHQQISLRWLYPTAALGMALILTGAQLQTWEAGRKATVLEARYAEPCFGVNALDPASSCPPSDIDHLALSLAASAEDQPWSRLPGSVFDPFTGDAVPDLPPFDHDVDVLIVGNSHALSWIPALQPIAEAHGWTLSMQVSEWCEPGVDYPADDPWAACDDWSAQTLAQVQEDPPDLVILASRSFATSDDQFASERGQAETMLQGWIDAGLPSVVVHDYPHAQADALYLPECVARNPHDFSQCTLSRVWDPWADASAALADPLSRTVDLTSTMCPEEPCQGVIGNVITMWDRDHMSATFSRSLSAKLEDALADAGVFALVKGGS